MATLTEVQLLTCLCLYVGVSVAMAHAQGLVPQTQHTHLFKSMFNRLHVSKLRFLQIVYGENRMHFLINIMLSLRKLLTHLALLCFISIIKYA